MAKSKSDTSQLCDYVRDDRPVAASMRRQSSSTSREIGAANISERILRPCPGYCRLMPLGATVICMVRIANLDRS